MSTTRIFAAVAAGVALLAATASFGAGTAPALVLDRGEAVRTDTGVWVRLEGSFPQGDLIQQPIEIQVLLRPLADPTRFARFELPTGAFEGSLASLSDGLSAAELQPVIDASLPTPAGRLLVLGPGRVELLLPPDFPLGAAEAQLFMIYRGDPILSNPLVFPVAELGS